ncbi:MAG: VCBS repeat-containing protein, partial [Acidobacteria bacterium]|nr:VCBS repeat-containing protein [Acidobacteriota bacterium]
VPGDYDGDGLADAAIWRASTQTWYVRGSRDGKVLSVPQGQAGDTPVRASR